MSKFLAIARNTALETLRQPIYGVLLWVAAGLLMLNPSLAAFSLESGSESEISSAESPADTDREASVSTADAPRSRFPRLGGALRHLAGLALLFAGVGTLAACGARWAWVCELACHFPQQYLWALSAATVVFLACRYRRRVQCKKQRG